MDSLKKLFSFIRYVADTFYADRCLRSSAALTYTTLLSLVPLSTVIFSVFSAFPMFDTFAVQIQTFVFENFVPTSGEAIQQYLEEFSSKTTRLTAIGTVFLILSALLMMNTIEGAINDIWHLSNGRKILSKFMVYWAMLTLGPILVGASLAVSSYLTSLPLFTETALIVDIKTSLLGLLPFFSTTLACTLLYAVVPNTYVPVRHAFVGAVIAAVLFEFAKKGFALYITAFPTYQLIYGALATIPVFLVWLYLSWMVVLLGAQISYCLHHRQGDKLSNQFSTGQILLNDFKLIGLMWQAQLKDKLLSEEELIQDDSLGKIEILTAISRLQESGLIHQTIDGQWALSKDSSRLTLADLYRAQANTLPELDPDLINQDPLAHALAKALSHSNNYINEAYSIRLQPIYQDALQKTSPPQNISEIQPGTTEEKRRIEPTIEL